MIYILVCQNNRSKNSSTCYLAVIRPQTLHFLSIFNYSGGLCIKFIFASMDQIFDSLNRFIKSNICVFDFKSIDYPTQFQQHLITNYFAMNELLKNHSQTDIVRLLHSSETYINIFIPGLLYQMLLDPQLAEQHFETYMPSLRSQSWTYLGKLLLHLLKDSFSWIKPRARSGIIPLISKLYYYGQLPSDLIVLAVKTIDYSDLSQNSLNYNNQMLVLFQKLLVEPVPKSFSYTLAKVLFYKIFRMLGLLICMEDQSLRQYKMRCVNIAERLFELQRQKCLVIGNSGINLLREIERQQLIAPLCLLLLQALGTCESVPQSPQSASMRLSAVLPMKVETTLLFIIKEGITKMQIKIQLDWIFSQTSQYSVFIIIDILRYLLALPSEDLPINQCLMILEWLFYRVCSNNILFEMWKDELFFSCFADPCPFPAAPERAMRFLTYLIQIDLDFGESLLICFLHRYSPDRSEILQSLLIKANQMQIIDLSFLINHSNLRPRTKEELTLILGHRPLNRAPSNSDQPVTYYDPLEPINRKESEMSLQFSDSQHSCQYLEPSDSNTPMIDEKNTSISNDIMGTIKLQKMFVEDMGDSLSKFMKDPTLETFRQFYKSFFTQIKEFRVSGQQTLIEKFIIQFAKVTYLLFQNQFEEHNSLPSKEENILLLLLNMAAAEWRVNSFQLQIIKKIIKKLSETFPTCEPCFWRHFLTNFKRSVIGVSRQMKDWLIPKEKTQYAVALLKELGPLSNQLIQNAEQLKLPLSL